MQREQIIRINQGRILRWEIRVILTILIFSTMLFVLFNFREKVAIALIVPGTLPVLLVWYSYYILQIDRNSHQLSTGYWWTGFQWLNSVSYAELNQVVIRSSIQNSEVSKFWSAKGRKSYKAFLIYDDGKELYLISSDSKRKLIELVDKIIRKSGETLKIAY